jgi:serine/threonine-protein kinase
MGEVYRARDLQLQREVAIKVLLPLVASDPERLGRFEREARVLATLNHPGIASVYGFERDGETPFLAMEYVAGSTLDQLAGKFDEAEVERYALQIAAAMAGAHEKSIIHRDLKPANVKITPEGKVKILDFGLAKALTPETAPQSPFTQTLSTIASGGTHVGMIMGTPSYMSPEQARGKQVDKRTDIWAFGALVYEMFSGHPAFGGETLTDILAHIVKDEPDWSVVPERWRSVLRACLEKDADKRLRDVGDVPLLLTASAPLPTASAPAPKRIGWAVSAACLVAGAGLMLAVMSGGKPADPPKPVSRFLIHPDVRIDRQTAIAISPNGRTILYQVGDSFGNDAVIRDLDQTSTRNQLVSNPSFSPDGKSLAIFRQASIQVISLDNGTRKTLVQNALEFNGSWGDDDSVVYRDRADGGLYRVKVQGGEPRKISSHILSYPHSLPGGEWLIGAESLPNAPANLAENARYDIVALNVKSQALRKLASGGSRAKYIEPGYLVYQADAALYAMTLNPRSMAVATPVRVMENVLYFDVSRSGTLLYATRPAAGEVTELIRTDRSGAVSRVATVSGTFVQLSLSPDENRLLMANTGSETDVWLYDLSRGVMTRLTTEPGEDEFPVWSPDGKRYAYCAQRFGESRKIVIRSPEGGTREEVVYDGGEHVHLGSWSSAGTLFFSIIGGEIRATTFDGAWRARSWLKLGFGEATAVTSPDGKWVAYSSMQTGKREIYVRPAQGDGQWQISQEGASSEPRWSSNGREVFYWNDRKLMTVPLETSSGFKPGAPRMLFQAAEKMVTQFAVTKDGQFLSLRRPQSGEKSELWLVENWVEEIKQRVRQ